MIGLVDFLPNINKKLQIIANTVTSARASSLPSPPSKEGGGQIAFAAANLLEPWVSWCFWIW